MEPVTHLSWKLQTLAPGAPASVLVEYIQWCAKHEPIDLKMWFELSLTRTEAPTLYDFKRDLSEPEGLAGTLEMYLQGAGWRSLSAGELTEAGDILLGEYGHQWVNVRRMVEPGARVYRWSRTNKDLSYRLVGTIISGNMPGVERGAILAALKLGLGRGGAFATVRDGMEADLFKVEANVSVAGATLVLAPEGVSDCVRSSLALGGCIKMMKPHYVVKDIRKNVDIGGNVVQRLGRRVECWLRSLNWPHNNRILNVVGFEYAGYDMEGLSMSILTSALGFQ